MNPTNSARQKELQNDPYWSKIHWKLAEIWRKSRNWKCGGVQSANHSFSFIVCFISQPIFIGFCFNMGHFEALPGGQNSLGWYSNSRKQGLTSLYSKFEFFEYSLDALAVTLNMYQASDAGSWASFPCGALGYVKPCTHSCLFAHHFISLSHFIGEAWQSFLMLNQIPRVHSKSFSTQVTFPVS